MKKITELTVKRMRTAHEKDADGNRVKKQVEAVFQRPVNVVAGGKRFAHFFVDTIVIILLIFLIGWVPHLIAGELSGFNVFQLWYGNFFSGSEALLFLAYYVASEHLWQRTPGKFLTKSLVIDEYGKKPTLSTNVLRNVIRFVPFETLSCLGERGWHDRWSNTFVVTEEENEHLQALLAEHKSRTTE